jgi:hypothetical protein
MQSEVLSAALGDNVDGERIAEIFWRRSAGIEAAVPNDGKDVVLVRACLYKSEPIASNVPGLPAAANVSALAGGRGHTVHFEVGMIMPATMGIGMALAHKGCLNKDEDWVVWIARIVKRLAGIRFEMTGTIPIRLSLTAD